MQIFRVVYENRVVFADEMDRVLNPILSDRVVAFVNGAEHRGQFIFSTHNVLHLNLKMHGGGYSLYRDLGLLYSYHKERAISSVTVYGRHSPYFLYLFN